MKKFYILIFTAVMFFAITQVSKSEDMRVAKAPVNPPPAYSLLQSPKVHYCSVRSVNVCVLTQSHDDCIKLGGRKVGSCRQIIESGNTADHSDHNGSCMARDDSQEPVSCYGF